MKEEIIKFKNFPAFSIIEAVVGIFMISIMGLTFFAVLSGAFKSQFYSRDKIIATNLAQEGIELVRNLRDNNWKRKRAAFDTTVLPGFPGFPAYDLDGEQCSDAYCGSGVYQYVGSVGSKFTRQIILKEIIDPNFGRSIIVTSQVTTSAGISVTIEDTLYPWAG
jgi:type II secretory pathway pseudopilin PulG